MKKLNLLLFIAITSLFISCDKDEDAVVIDEAAFSGEWQMTGYEITDAETTFDFLGETFTVSTATTGKDFDYTLTVTDNPNLITGEGSFTAVVTTSLLGETETLEETVSDVFAAGSWRIDGNQLFIKTEDEEETISTIKTLTTTTLIIEQSFEAVVEDPTLGTESTAKGTLTVTFEK